MGLITIFKSLGLALAVLGLMMLAPLFFALATENDAAANYFFSFAICELCAFGLIFAGSGARSPSDLRGAILVVLLWWTVAPLFGALPFLLEGRKFIGAYFGGVSALTTTGAWLSESEARANDAHLLWRAVMQWLGGLSSIAIAAAIFIRPMFIGIDTLIPPFSRGERGSDFRAIYSAVMAFFPVLAALTFICAGLLAIFGAPVFDAVVTALSVTASGGLTPSEQGLAAFGSAALGVLMFFVFLSGANFVLVARVARGRQSRLRDMETGAYATMVIFVGLLFWLVLGAGDLDLIPTQAFNAASLLSTNGFILGEAPTLPVALVAVIIGGSAISTAGGFKVLRWLVILRRGREEIRRLIDPSAVFGKSTISVELGVWMHFLALTLVLAILTLILTSGGHSFELAATAATGLLSNAGPVLHLVEEGAEGYGVFENPGLRSVMIVAMILGRLEAVTAIALFNAAFWRS